MIMFEMIKVSWIKYITLHDFKEILKLCIVAQLVTPSLENRWEIVGLTMLVMGKVCELVGAEIPLIWSAIEQDSE